MKKYCFKHRLIHNSRYDAELYHADYLLNHSDYVPSNWYELYKAYHCEVCNGWHTTTRARQTNKQFTIILKGLEIMSFDFEVKWDEPEELDESNLNTGSFPDWGLLELKAVKNVTLFAKGESLVLPEIIVNGQPFSRNGIKAGGPTKLFVFTVKGTNSQTGEPFTAVRLYHNQTQFKIEDGSKYPHLYLTEKQQEHLNKNGSVYVSDWVNLQKPTLFNVLKEKVKQLSNGGLWVCAENTTYHVRENPDQLDNDGKPRKYYSKYWSGFTVYPNEADMLAARKAEMGDSNGVTASPYPTTWQISEQWPLDTFLGIAKKALEDTNDLKQAAIKAKLLNADGSLTDTSTGDKVSLETIANVFGRTVNEVKQAGITDSPF